MRRTWFWLGEVTMAGLLAAVIAVPAGIWFAGRTNRFWRSSGWRSYSCRSSFSCRS